LKLWIRLESFLLRCLVSNTPWNLNVLVVKKIMPLALMDTNIFSANSFSGAS
jgi:hypothetical protein